jgi:hypothetical protein
MSRPYKNTALQVEYTVHIQIVLANDTVYPVQQFVWIPKSAALLLKMAAILCMHLNGSGK